MFSSTTRAVHVQHLRDLLAEAQQEAHSLNSEYQQVAERPVGGVVELVPVVTAPEERHPRLRQDTAYLRSLIDRRRPSDARMLLRGKPYLLGEYVRIGPNQTALTYAMNQDQDQGMLDVIAVLREVASERADKG